MSSQTEAERQLAELLVESLNLDGVVAGEIDPEAPLFNTGLGLDSIDALELALAISRKYGFQLRSDNEDNRRIFASLRALSEHIEQNNLQPFYEQIFDMGYSPGRTFGKVLVSAQEQELTNFYEAWIELISA